MKELITDTKKKNRILNRELKDQGIDLATGKSLTIRSVVRCIHCGEVYAARALKLYKTDEDDYLVYCKNEPECSGSIIDLIDSEDEWFD